MMQLVIFLILGASLCAISHGCSHGTVKLMNQTTLSTSFGSLQSGTVVICINGKWSFVCSSQWSHTVAKVTCVDMGLSQYGAIAFPLIPSSSVNLPVSVSSISCRGDELSLLECSVKTIGKAAAADTAPTADIGAVGFMGHDDSDDTIEVHSGSGSGFQPVTHCRSHAVAGIICQSRSNGDHSKCATGDLQLDPLTGRLEICINNQWGGVCHENWTSKETLIVHKQLSMDCPLEAVSVRSLPRGFERVFYKGFACNGSEGNILECSNEIDDTLSSCGSTGTIVGLMCTELSICNSNGSIRLISSNSSVAKNVTKSQREGIVQMCVDQAWKVVCASRWTSLEASVVCQQIGFSVKGARPIYAPLNTIPGEVFEVGKPIKCNGTEDGLFDCLQQTSLSPSCENNLYAAVQCQEICTEGRVYIEKEIVSSNTIVFLYICIDGIMRVIHDTNWTLTDASIACKTAGFTKYGARPVSWISPNPGVPGLNAIHCTGQESTITDCSRGSLILSNHSMTGAICHSSEDEELIGIVSNCTTGGLRLVNMITGSPNTRDFDGIVQMCINGLWKPLCHDAGTDEDVGKVTCDQLGFGKQELHPFAVLSRHGSGVHLNLNCNGNESSLLECAQIIHLSKFRMLTCNFVTKVYCSAPSVQISSLTPKSVSAVVSEGSYTSSIKLTCSAIGSPPLVVRWTFLSTNLTVAYLRTFTNTVSGLNVTSVLTISDPTPASNGEYECIVENSHGVVRSRKSTVTIKVPPMIDMESEPFAEEGASAVIVCTGVGYPSPLLSLSKNGVRILSSSSSCHITSNSVFPGVYKCTLKYGINNVNISDAGSYTCEASTNGTFLVQYKSTYISVWGAPKVVKKPVNTTVFLHPSDPGVVANLTCIVKGSPLPVIDWYRIAKGTLKSLIEGNNEDNRWRIITKSSLSESTVYSSLLISNVRSEDQGMYQCIGANSVGSVRTEASLYVHADHSAVIQALPSPVLLEGSKLTLLCSVYHQFSATGKASFTWTKNDEPIKQEIPCNSVMTFRSISLSDSGQYQCIYTTPTGQTLRASINIRVEARLKIELKGESPVVFGRKMWLMVESNKPTSGIQCSIGRLTKDCSSGEVTFDDLSCSLHNTESYPLSLTVNATSALGEVSLIVRKFYMDSPLLCSVHLINGGITVNDSRVTVEFTGMGPIKYYKCSMDSKRPRLCSSPLVLKNVPGGYHTLTIKPRGCYNRVEKPLSDNFMIL